MKARNLVIGIFLVGGVVAMGGAGFANACGGPGNHHMGPHGGGKMIHTMRNLDLTKEQRQSIRSIKNENRDLVQIKMEEIMDIRKDMVELAKADDYDANKVHELAAIIAKIKMEVTVHRVGSMNRIRKVMTSEQLSQLDASTENWFRR